MDKSWWLVLNKVLGYVAAQMYTRRYSTINYNKNTMELINITDSELRIEVILFCFYNKKLIQKSQKERVVCGI